MGRLSTEWEWRWPFDSVFLTLIEVSERSCLSVGAVASAVVAVAAAPGFSPSFKAGTTGRERGETMGLGEVEGGSDADSALFEPFLPSLRGSEWKGSAGVGGRVEGTGAEE